MPPEDVSYVSEFSPEEIEDRQYSTLDLCDFNAFTLLADSREEWIDRFNTARDSIRQKPFEFKLFAIGSDFSFVDSRHDALFSIEGGLGHGGALLIRPDQHILTRLEPTDSPGRIRDIIFDHLGLP
jgi:hypothetical protein